MKNELFYRNFQICRSALDEKARTVSVSFSSETPVRRWFGNEYLLHGPNNVDLSRLKVTTMRNLTVEKSIAKHLGISGPYEWMIAFGVPEVAILRALIAFSTAEIEQQRHRMLFAMADYRLRDIGALTDEIRQVERERIGYQYKAIVRGLPVFNI